MWYHGKAPSLGGETKDFTGFSGRWNYPPRRGIRPLYKLSDLGYNTMQAIDHVDCAKKEQGWDSELR